MATSWDREDYEAMYQRQLHFNDEQSRQLASRCGSPAPSGCYRVTGSRRTTVTVRCPVVCLANSAQIAFRRKP